LDPVGYKIALELLVKCGCRNVREAPIRFMCRHAGRSKMNTRERINFIRHLVRLMAFKYLREPLTRRTERNRGAAGAS
jgi:dolichol-phosphate mannosyltransferase